MQDTQVNIVENDAGDDDTFEVQSPAPTGVVQAATQFKRGVLKSGSPALEHLQKLRRHDVNTVASLSVTLAFFGWRHQCCAPEHHASDRNSNLLLALRPAIASVMRSNFPARIIWAMEPYGLEPWGSVCTTLKEATYGGTWADEWNSYTEVQAFKVFYEEFSYFEKEGLGILFADKLLARCLYEIIWCATQSAASGIEPADVRWTMNSMDWSAK